MSADAGRLIEPFRRVRFPAKEGEIAGIAFGDQSRPVEIVFLHATGMNARTYTQMLAPLGERFHVLALDMRGHGQTHLPLHLWSYYSWRRHRDDIIALADAHFDRSVTFAGHSMGATTSLMIAGERPDLVRSLALIDPVILTESRYRMMEMPFAPLLTVGRGPLARNAARRRADFPSREDAIQSLTGRGFFKTFPPEVLADYVADGFVDKEGGGVTLACTPRFEAATFTAQRNDPWRALQSFKGPIVLLRAEIGSTCPPSIAKRIKDVRPDLRMAVLEGATHALPMERPDRVRAAIETAAMMARSNQRLDDID